MKEYTVDVAEASGNRRSILVQEQPEGTIIISACVPAEVALTICDLVDRIQKIGRLGPQGRRVKVE